MKFILSLFLIINSSFIGAMQTSSAISKNDELLDPTIDEMINNVYKLAQQSKVSATEDQSAPASSSSSSSVDPRKLSRSVSAAQIMIEADLKRRSLGKTKDGKEKDGRLKDSFVSYLTNMPADEYVVASAQLSLSGRILQHDKEKFLAQAKAEQAEKEAAVTTHLSRPRSNTATN